MIYESGSGHPGGSLSICKLLSVLYYAVLKVDPKNAHDPDRDRFILSKGHGVPALYAVLAKKGPSTIVAHTVKGKGVSFMENKAHCEKIPFVCTFSFLLTLRAADQIRSQISYPALNVKLIGTNGGLSGFSDGVTHQSIMALATMRAMPNFSVIVPSDAITMKSTIHAAVEHRGPVFVRIPRVEAPIIHDPKMVFEIGRGIRFCEGSDVTIIAMGMMVCCGLEAAEKLALEGISTDVIKIHTIQPLESEKKSKDEFYQNLEPRKKLPTSWSMLSGKRNLRWRLH